MNLKTAFLCWLQHLICILHGLLHLRHIQRRSPLAFIQVLQQKCSQHSQPQLPAFSKSIPEAEASQIYWSHLAQLPPLEQLAFRSLGPAQSWDFKPIPTVKMPLLKVLDSSTSKPRVLASAPHLSHIRTGPRNLLISWVT